MEKYRGVLIAIFLGLTFLIPTVIAIRVFSTAFSGFREKQPKKEPAAEDNAENTGQSPKPPDEAAR